MMEILNKGEKEMNDEEKEATELIEDIGAISDENALGNVVAKNEEAMFIAESEEDNDESGEDFIPSFFIDDEDRHRVSVDLLFDKKTGRVLSVSRAGLIDLSGFNNLYQTKQWFDFSVPNYDDISRYRQRSTIDRNGRTVIDPIKLRNYFLVWCLKDWSLTDKSGERQELNFNENDALDDKSIAKVYSMPPAILDVVLSIFEKDVVLTE
jgi:hypothetical protein